MKKHQKIFFSLNIALIRKGIHCVYIHDLRIDLFYRLLHLVFAEEFSVMNHPNWRNRELALQKFYQLDEEKGDLFHNEEVEFNDHQLHQTKSLQLVLELLHDEHTRNRIHAMRILW